VSEGFEEGCRECGRSADTPLGQPLKRKNAQLTHILIAGMWVADAGSSVAPAQASKRMWVVKVVRREAVVSVIV
jgi:hypothetical protein